MRNLKKIVKVSTAIGAASLAVTGTLCQPVLAVCAEAAEPDVKDTTNDEKELSCTETMQELLKVDVAEGDESKYTGVDLPDGRHIYGDGGKYFVSAGGKMTALPVVEGTLNFNDIKYVKKADSLIEDVYTTDEGSKVSVGKCEAKNALVVDGRVIKNAISDDGLLRLDKVAKAIGFELEGNTLKLGNKIKIVVKGRYVKVSGDGVESKREKLYEIRESGGDVYVSDDFFRVVFGVEAIDFRNNLYISGNDLMPRYYVLSKNVKLSAESEKSKLASIFKKGKKKNPKKEVKNLVNYEFGVTKDLKDSRLYMIPNYAVYENGYVIPAENRAPSNGDGGCEVCDLCNPFIKGSFNFKLAPVTKSDSRGVLRTGYFIGDRVVLDINDKGINGSPTFYVDGYRTWYTYNRVAADYWLAAPFWNKCEQDSSMICYDAIIDFANKIYQKLPGENLGVVAEKIKPFLSTRDGERLDSDGEGFDAIVILEFKVREMGYDYDEWFLIPFFDGLTKDNYETTIYGMNASEDMKDDLNDFYVDNYL